MKDKRFYNFITNNNETELYVYGDIISGSEKWSEDDVTFKDFSDTLSSLNQNTALNIFINSGGGSIFATQSIISLLQRAKDTKNITVNAYIDGLAASCASWLPMIADNLYVYKQSIMMLHKPMTIAIGNSNDMQKQINILDKLENDVMIPSYLSKANDGVTEEQIKSMLNIETWLNATEICQYFNAKLLEDSKEIVACTDSKYFDKYINVPENLLNRSDNNTKSEEIQETEDIVDSEIIENNDKNSIGEEKINLLKNKIKELELYTAIQRF